MGVATSKHLLVAGFAMCALILTSAPAWAKPAETGKVPACPSKVTESIEADKFKLLGGEQIAFFADHQVRDVTIPLTLPPRVDAKRVKVALVQARRDKLVDEALNKHFEVAESLVATADSPLIKVTVNDIGKLAPASYTLVLRLSIHCVVTTHLTATLERPGFTLQKPEKVNLDVTMPLGFGLSKGSAAAETLKLIAAENAGASALSTPTFRDVGWRTSAPENINASLGTSTVAPSGPGSLVLKFSPSGFPMGTSTGKLEISSPDLKVPVSIDFEVRTRLHSIWIPLLVALGILVGLQVRERLPQFIALRQAEAAGAAATVELRQKLEPIGDQRFRDAVRKPLGDLEALWNAKARRWAFVERATSIVAAQGAAKKAVDEAIAELTPRLQTAQAALRSLAKISVQPDLLPPPMRGVFGKVPEAVEAATALLENQDAAGAQAALDAARTELVRGLRREWAAWQQTYPALDADLNMLRALMDPRRDAARGFSTGSTLLAQRVYELVTSNLATPDFDDLDAVARALQAWKDFGSARAVALLQWASYISADVRSFLWLVGSRAPEEQARTAKSALEEAASVVIKVSDALLEDLQGQVGRAMAFAPVVVDAKPLFSAMSDLVRELVARSNPDTTTKGTVLGHLDQRQYFSAVLALPYNGKVEWAQADGDPTKGLDVQDAADRVAVGTAFAMPPPTPLPRVDAATLEQLRTRATRDLLIAQRWTTVIVGAITVVVSYAFFHDRFLGTTGDVMGLFFWGMSADLTAAGITALQSNLGTPPKKAA